MDEKMKEFRTRLLETFRIEAEEHIRAITAGLMDLEKKPERKKLKELIETIFREVHSLKGAARSVDLRDVEAVCQPFEGAFSALKNGEIALSSATLDLLHRAVNTVSWLISSTQEERTPEDRTKDRELIRQLNDISQGAVSSAAKAAAWDHVTAAPPVGEDHDKIRRHTTDAQFNLETVRIPTARLDPVLIQAEEMILVKLAAGQRVIELKEIKNALVSLKAGTEKWRKRTAAPEARQSELMPEWYEADYTELQDKVAAVTRVAEQDFRTVKRMVDDHLESIKQVLMLPALTLVEGFPKLVRDLANDQGKKAELVISGAEIEIDKRILEELKDPIIHLLRNSVDHGIKKPEERVLLNKTPKGTINLIFRIKDGHQLEILVSDDGDGIDEKQVQTVLMKTGHITKDVVGKLDQERIISFIFKSGITTSPIISDISGRGLGLAIVREKVENLGGLVTVNSNPGMGTTFRLVMPLTLSTFSGILVRVYEQVFVLPTLNVECVKRISREENRTVENRETIRLDGQIIALVRLGDVLELSVNNIKTTDTISVVVIFYGDTRIAFQVDEVLEEHQVFVKGLGSQLKRVRNIAGATVLGTGRVVPVLNVPDLLKSALGSSAAFRPKDEVLLKTGEKGRILVAEDSITSRTLIRNILETAGYRVSTAVDGMDGLTRVRTDDFDLVVSDVDMPRMNGFELTAKIRSDKKLGDLPVVLVTALESREDREHGIEVGANAYIVKSSFDQSNLLEVVKRLI